MSETRTSGPAALIRNLIVGLTVSVVALSLGAAFGILSGRGAFAGMISAGIISILTSLLGRTRVQCSGPTAPMSVVAATVIALAHDDDPASSLRRYPLQGRLRCLRSGNAIGYLGRFSTRGPPAPDAIFVAHKEMLLIAGTTLVTVLWTLNTAVGIFTLLFYLINKVVQPKNPIRDLKRRETTTA